VKLRAVHIDMSMILTPGYTSKQLFNTKVFFIVFLCLQFAHVVFEQNEISKNAAHKMLIIFF